MIDAWHRVVGAHDPIVHLGDLALGRSGALRALLAALTGAKFLLQGNHDRQSAAYYLDLGFTLIPPFFMSVLGWTVSFTPGPHSELVGHPKHLNVHGHIHEKLVPSVYHVNCAVEWTGYAPVRIEELLVQRIAHIADAAAMERVVPLPYAEWLVHEYGGEILRSDIARFPDENERDRVREAYTSYRITADQS